MRKRLAWWLSWLERRPVTAEVVGSNPIRVVNTAVLKKAYAVACAYFLQINMCLDGFPSGQRGQTVNLLSTTSVVRIHPHPLWDLSSAGRASALQAEGHRFEPCRPHQFCRLGSMAEQLICNQQVVGSTPTVGSISLMRKHYGY